MEESAQMLEIESLIPMLLQPDSSNLKHITLIGDHHQLPPVVSNETIKRYSNFDQSMFARMIRLGASLLFLLLVSSSMRSLWCVHSGAVLSISIPVVY
jgi:intron-binding protein aquarius